MNMYLSVIFWVSVFMIFYVYLGYPVSLKILSVFKKNEVIKKYITPKITFIISAYNEEKRIKEKLENTINLNYPKELMQIIIVSDGSTDKTNEIVKVYKGIQLIESKEHKGKESAQIEAIKKAEGEIYVFSDVATLLNKDGLMEIIANFADPAIGCVSSVDKILSNGEKQIGGEGFYVKYEMWLRAMESRVKSVVGLSGSFFAARNVVCSDFSNIMQSDFKTLLNSMKKGLRGVSDSNAIGHYMDIKEEKKELNRKVRTVVRGLTVFFNNLEFINVFKFGLFSYMFVCHKFLRWAVPLFLLVVLMTNIFLFNLSYLYKISLCAQISFYMFALAGITILKTNTNKLIKVASFFVMANISIIIAWLKFIKGERIVLWQSSVR